MVITRTPFRVSFFGGGTDYPAWYLKNGGSVLATSIDKYCYLTARYLPPFFEHRYHIVYSKNEVCRKIEEIQHPAVREILIAMEFERGLELHHDGDLPARSGMGSSSSFVVGLLHALHALRGQMISKQDLTREAIRIEQEWLREVVGCQDQVLAAHGGFNLVRFETTGEITVQPVTISPDRLQQLNDHLLLFYTGLARTSSQVAASYMSNLASKEHQLRAYGEMVQEALNILSSSQSLLDFGRLLHEAWKLKRSLGEGVSNSEIDTIYATALKSGAVGGKLLGAGGGGFLLIFAAPENHAMIKAKLNTLLEIPFRFERSGSQVIFFDHQIDYSNKERDRVTQNLRPFSEATVSAPVKNNSIIGPAVS
jgi:D-glycero-alpha-D-manno-heptose-7-phosphate kinase